MYIWLMELVKLVAMVPEEISNPPIITTSWNPKRLVITEERGPEDPWRPTCCLVWYSNSHNFIVTLICASFGVAGLHPLDLISRTHHWRSWQTRRWRQPRRPDCWSLQTPPLGPGGRCQSSWWCHRWKPPPRRRPRPPPIPSLHQGPLGTRWAPGNVLPWLHTVPCPAKRKF